MECKFQDGKLKNNGYDKFYYRFYKFKDEDLSKYGMLVCSCNNNAGENITKDLPNGNYICSALQGDTEHDSEEKILGLQEIENLFNLKKTSNVETYKVKKRISEHKYKTEMVDLPDIYFSWLAHRLLSGDESMDKEMKEWGLISAPLGKRSNISQYCYHVLNPLIDEFLKSNEKRKERISEYRKYVSLFHTQIEVVRELENEIILYSELEDTYRKKCDEIEKSIFEISNNMSEIYEAKSLCISEKAKKECRLSELEDEFVLFSNQLEN